MCRANGCWKHVLISTCLAGARSASDEEHTDQWPEVQKKESVKPPDRGQEEDVHTTHARTCFRDRDLEEWIQSDEGTYGELIARVMTLHGYCRMSAANSEAEGSMMREIWKMADGGWRRDSEHKPPLGQ